MAKMTTEELMKAASEKQPSTMKVKFRGTVVDLTEITLNKVTSPYAIVQYETFDDAGSLTNAWVAAVEVVKSIGDSVIVKEVRTKDKIRTEQLSVYKRQTTK
jgi:hypothetical protein